MRFFVSEINAIETKKKEEKARKKRQKSVVVGDMKPLEDTLPTLELLMKETGTTNKHR